MKPARQVVVRLVPTPAGHDIRPGLDVLARAAGHRDLADLQAKAKAVRS